jgi:hypothetical protein
MSIAFGLADKTRQALGAADARHHAKVDFGLAEFGSVSSDDEIAHHRQFAPAAQRIATNSGDDRLAHAQQRLGLGGKKSASEHRQSFSAISLISAPAAKAFSEPVMTMQRTLSLLPAAPSASASSPSKVLFSAFSASGGSAGSGDVVVNIDDQRFIGHGLASFGCCNQARLA